MRKLKLNIEAKKIIFLIVFLFCTLTTYAEGQKGLGEIFNAAILLALFFAWIITVGLGFLIRYVITKKRLDLRIKIRIWIITFIAMWIIWFFLKF